MELFEAMRTTFSARDFTPDPLPDGVLWRILDKPPAEVDVTLVGRRCRPKRGVRRHTVAALDKRDIRRKGEVPLTSPAR